MAAVISQARLPAPCPSPFAPCLLERMDTSYLSNPLSLSRPLSLSAAPPPLSTLTTQQEVYASLSLPWPPLRKLRLSEGSQLASARLASASLRLSPTQPSTPGRGNSCMFHALLDQLRHQPGLERTAASHGQLRAKLVQAAFNSVRAGKLTWAGEGGTVEEWRASMAQEGTMGDQLVLQAAANLFRRDLVIQPVFQDAAHMAEVGVTVVRPSGELVPGSAAPMWLQYYSESRFLTPHYQSVLPCPGPNPILAFLSLKRQEEEVVEEEEEEEVDEEEEDDIFMKLNSLPDPPTTPSRSLRSTSSLSTSSSDNMSPTPSISTSPSPSSPFSRPSSSSSSNSSSSLSSTYQFMHLLGHQVQGVGRQTRI